MPRAHQLARRRRPRRPASARWSRRWRRARRGRPTPSAVSSASPTAILLSRTMSQWSLRKVPEACRERGLRRVRHGGHADHLDAERPRVRRHLHGQRVAPGQGDDEQQVARACAGWCPGRRVASPSTRSRALPRVAGRDVDADRRPGREQVHQGEPAGAVDDVLGGQARSGPRRRRRSGRRRRRSARAARRPPRCSPSRSSLTCRSRPIAASKKSLRQRARRSSPQAPRVVADDGPVPCTRDHVEVWTIPLSTPCAHGP